MFSSASEIHKFIVNFTIRILICEPRNAQNDAFLPEMIPALFKE
jgi:hypothetical protein